MKGPQLWRPSHIQYQFPTLCLATSLLQDRRISCRELSSCRERPSILPGLSTVLHREHPDLSTSSSSTTPSLTPLLAWDLPPDLPLTRPTAAPMDLQTFPACSRHHPWTFPARSRHHPWSLLARSHSPIAPTLPPSFLRPTVAWGDPSLAPVSLTTPQAGTVKQDMSVI